LHLVKTSMSISGTENFIINKLYCIFLIKYTEELKSKGYLIEFEKGLENVIDDWKLNINLK